MMTKEEFKNLGEKSYRAEQVYEWIYKKKVNSFDDMTNLSIDLREKLKENLSTSTEEVPNKVKKK